MKWDNFSLLLWVITRQTYKEKGQNERSQLQEKPMPIPRHEKGAGHHSALNSPPDHLPVWASLLD